MVDLKAIPLAQRQRDVICSCAIAADARDDAPSTCLGARFKLRRVCDVRCVTAGGRRS